MKFFVEPRPPFSFDLITSLYARFRTQCVDLYHSGIYERVLRAKNKLFLVRVKSVGSIEKPKLQVEVFPAGAKKGVIEGQIKISDFLTKKGSSFYTTNFVFSETITVLSQRIDHQTAINFIVDFKNLKEVNLIRVNEEIEEMAIKIFKSQTSKNVSFVDCLNMAVLKKYNWDTIFSFDKIYRRNGFKLATAPKL